MAKPLQWYLKLLACLTVVSGLGQMGFPTRLGADSAWGAAPGWQREIAFWNLAMYIVIARAIRADDAVCSRAVAIALVTLQLLAATNHAEAAIASHALLNVVMCAVNYGCAAFGILALRARPAGVDARSGRG